MANPVFHRVRFFTSNGDGTYSNFKDEDADFQDQRGYGYKLNNVSQDTQSDEIFRIIQDILDGLRRSGHLQETRIATITSPYSIVGSLLPFMIGSSPMHSLVSFTMPATRYMQIHVLLDPVRGGRKRKRKTKRKSTRL